MRVTGCEGACRERVVFVLPDTLLEIRGDADVELFEVAGEDVDVGELRR